MAQSNEERRDFKYWRTTKEALARSLRSSLERGLSNEEAGKRLGERGKNDIVAAKETSALEVLLRQFKNPLVYVLVAATIIAGFLGEVVEAIVIIAIVALNSGMGFVQEYKAEKTVKELRKLLSHTTVVIRGGEHLEIDSRDVAEGDLVILSAGDIVPADIRLVEVRGLAADESVLTGESKPVRKNAGVSEKEELVPHEISNVAFAGTSIVEGWAKGIAVTTGQRTYFGKTARYVEEEYEGDFQRSMKSFGNMLLKLIIVLTVFVFAANALLGKGILSSLIFALALAVGITPEVLPTIITLSLSKGARMLSRKKVVVKTLHSIEDLGNVDVFCADKTGTLTENAVTLENWVDAEGRQDERLFEYALLCNTAVVHGHRVSGNQLDASLWNHALAAKFDQKRLAEYKRLEEVPFDYKRRRMGVVVETGAGRRRQRVLIVKGAPESVFNTCTKVLVEGKEVPMRSFSRKLQQAYVQYGRQGYRVIALAFKNVDRAGGYSARDEGAMTFAGFFTFTDPPKKDAAEALKTFEHLKVGIKILSGDDPVVTEHVCEQVGLKIANGKIVLGHDLEKMSEESFKKTIEEANVFARLTPEQKLEIVKTLSASGHIVGFLGDGVNDAPALKAADVGISVREGAGIAKEAADVVLLKKSLHVIADGISEGRRTFQNITKYVMNTMSANYGNMTTIALSSLFLKYIPLLPSQVLLNNFASDVPLLSVSTDNVDKDTLHKPRRWNIGFITKFMLFFGGVSTVFDFLTIGLLVYVINAPPELFRTGWFLESVLSEIVVTFAIRTRKPFYASRPSALLVALSLLTAAAVCALVYSPLGAFFEFVQMPAWFFTLIILIVAMYFLVAELAKYVFYRRNPL